MTEREAILHAVLKNTRDRTPLLIYADWLDERPELPAASATAELIRLACERKCGAWLSMPPWCLPWLEENWKRLIPSVLAANELITEPSDRWPEVPKDGMYVAMNCDEITTYITLPGTVRWQTKEKIKLYSCRLVLTPGFGLLRRWKMTSTFGREVVEPILKIDQPQLFLPPPPAEPIPPRSPEPDFTPPEDRRTLAELLAQ